MPKYYAKHVPPPTICSRFSPERDVLPFKPALIKRWPIESRVAVVNKPPGDVGRHYRLKDLISIPGTDFKEMQSTIHEAARAELDTAQAFSAQDSFALDTLCRKIASQYPILNKFPDHWVTKDFLRMYLKNTSCRARYNKGIHRRKTK